MKLITALLLCLLVTSATGDTRIHAGAWTVHPWESSATMNENHRLIGLEHNSWTAAYFRNSFDEDSFFAGYRFSKSYGHLMLSAAPGLSYGYRDCRKGRGSGSRKVCPAALFAATWTEYQLEPSLINLAGAFGASFAWRF